VDCARRSVVLAEVAHDVEPCGNLPLVWKIEIVCEFLPAYHPHSDSIEINGVPTHYKIRGRWESGYYCFDNCARGIPAAGCETDFTDAGEEDDTGLAFCICSSMVFGSRSLV
jgi:hypothetical protein